MPETSMSQRSNTSEQVSHMKISSQQHNTFENDHKSEHSKTSKPAADNPFVVDDQEKQLQTSQAHVKDVQHKSQTVSARSCTKVSFCIVIILFLTINCSRILTKHCLF
jgi:hypothetical protein